MRWDGVSKKRLKTNSLMHHPSGMCYRFKRTFIFQFTTYFRALATFLHICHFICNICPECILPRVIFNLNSYIPRNLLFDGSSLPKFPYLSKQNLFLHHICPQIFETDSQMPNVFTSDTCQRLNRRKNLFPEKDLNPETPLKPLSHGTF